MKKILKVLEGQSFSPPPIWMMRQAGRYLPEYRELRKTAATFLDLAYNPMKAAEVTLQPIRRFGFDAAILFSDILVIPDALGQGVAFETGEGPRLFPTFTEEMISLLKARPNWKVLENVYETIRLVKSELPQETTFLGFCGAPFTVASYMVAGRGKDEQEAVRLLAYRNPVLMQKLMDILVEASVDYLEGQIRAGVDAVQIFDSWAGVLPTDEFIKWCVTPTQQIIAKLRARIPSAKVIYFPRAVGDNLALALETKADGYSLDWRTNMGVVKRDIAPFAALQGQLDPLALLTGGDALKRAVNGILEAYEDTRFIFNLGHGITPNVPVAHVEQLLKLVRG